MGDALDPGNMKEWPNFGHQMPGDFQSSMASAIENALLALLRQDNMHDFAVETNAKDARDRRRLLIAIAQGVVSHLVANGAAFQVTGTDSTGQPIKASISISPGGTLLGNL